MGFNLHKPEKKSERVTILLTGSEWLQLDEAAKEEKVSHSEFLRSLLRWYIEEDTKKQEQEQIEALSKRGQ
jgi:metal-responsive CopG/Arc/MetJ family transcriptional regulator